MNKNFQRIAIALFAALGVCLFCPLPARASVTIGGYTFNNDAFADSLIASSGTFTTNGGSVASVLTDKDPGTYAFSISPGASVTLGFTDNILYNGPGADLVLFELGNPDTFTLTLNGQTRSYLSVDTGSMAGGFELNAVAINLDDFGFPAFALVSPLPIGLSTVSTVYGTVPSLSLVGALNSISIVVPEPSVTAIVCFLAAAGAGVAWRRNPARKTIS